VPKNMLLENLLMHVKGKNYGKGVYELEDVADGNSHKTRNSTLSSKTRSSNTRSEKATRASTTGVDESEGQCPEGLISYC
jgi:hypothetical protein